MLAIDLAAFGKWMLTLCVSILFVGTSFMGTLNLLSQRVYRPPPAEPRVAPAQMRSVPPIALVTPVAAAEPAPSARPVAETAPVPAHAEPAIAEKPKMIATLSLAVRAGPSKQSPQIGGLETGEITTISGTDHGWMRVTTSSGVSGWAYGRYLKPLDPHIVADSPFWAASN